MVLELELKNFARKVAFLAAALGVCSLLMTVIISRFVVGTLSDNRLGVSRGMLAAPLEYFPNSARLNARYAEAEMAETDRDLDRAEFHALRAINLSPNDYRFQLILSAVREAKGDRAAAEEALKAALALAPNDRDVHWRLANVMLREGKLVASLEEFRVAVAANPALLPGTLDLIWRASRGNFEAVETVAGADPKSRLALAQFLVSKSRIAEASNVFRGVDRPARLAAAESAAVLTSLINAGQADLARELWAGLVAEGDAQPQLIWNGGFEADLLKNFPQFDWTFGRSEYARLSFDGGRARTGARSLRVDFLGRDTTKLDGEIKQLVVLRPGARYRLECYAKSEGLVTPEGPRVVVTDNASNWVAASEPVAAGSNDWKLLAVEFVAPRYNTTSASPVLVSVKRKPKFSYDEPTQGTIWFDDFTIKEQ
jgi:tetratricopeptide (TPR) repeat protein